MCLQGAADGEKRLGNALVRPRSCEQVSQRCAAAVQPARWLDALAVVQRGASPGRAAALNDSEHGAAAALSHQLPAGPGAALL